MTGERQLGARREDAQAARVVRVVRRQHEDRLREVQLPGHPPHLFRGETPAVRKDGQGVATEDSVGEDVGGEETVTHVGPDVRHARITKQAARDRSYSARTLPGPAAFTASSTPLSYFLKFSANMSASFEAWAS